MNILICGVNWLGDSVMSMPAVQLLRARRPGAHVSMLVKPRVAELWRMQRCVDEVIELLPGRRGTWRVARELRMRDIERAYVFPNSFRSGLIPWLARVRERVGVRGHGRGWMLTQRVTPPSEPAREHQVWEYLQIVGLADDPDAPGGPRLESSPDRREEVLSRFGLKAGEPLAAIMPGAAYGPSKRWPAQRFAAVGREFAERASCRVLVLGSTLEVQLCARVAEGIGPAAVDGSGRTTLEELTRLLACCRVVVANDSGGMHLACAAGSRVVAVFGITDPSKTGPLGPGHRVVASTGVRRSRDLPRDCPEATEALDRVRVEDVLGAAVEAWSAGA